MAPTSKHIPTVAQHIVNLLQTPDIMFVQEIQDNSGPTNDGVVDANVTLSTLVKAIAAISNVTYQWASVNPVDGEDGGQPGGNIRTAFLYKPEKLQLVAGSPAGGSLDAATINGKFLRPKLTYVLLHQPSFQRIKTELNISVSTPVALTPQTQPGTPLVNRSLPTGKPSPARISSPSTSTFPPRVAAPLHKETLVHPSTPPSRLVQPKRLSSPNLSRNFSSKTPLQTSSSRETSTNTSRHVPCTSPYCLLSFET